jgi:hypothetical protein
MEGVTLSPGQKRYQGGRLIAEGGADPRDAETARHNKAMEGIQAQSNTIRKTEGEKALSDELLRRAQADLYTNLQSIKERAAAMEENGKAPSKQWWDEERLQALNSYRVQIQLPTFTRLPKDWGGPGEPIAKSHGPGESRGNLGLAPAGSAPPPGMVRMEKDGQQWDVPAVYVDHYKSKGVKVVSSGRSTRAGK